MPYQVHWARFANLRPSPRGPVPVSRHGFFVTAKGSLGGLVVVDFADLARSTAAPGYSLAGFNDLASSWGAQTIRGRTLVGSAPDVLSFVRQEMAADRTAANRWFFEDALPERLAEAMLLASARDLLATATAANGEWMPRRSPVTHKVLG